MKLETLAGEQLLSDTNKNNGIHIEITHWTGLHMYKCDRNISDIKFCVNTRVCIKWELHIETSITVKW